MSTITWLHISDLHWHESWAYDENVVAQALLRDLRNRAGIDSCLARIDFICVTGDLAFSGKSQEYILAEHFLRDLVDVTGVDRRNLFIVPGNHDVDWSLIDPAAIQIVDGLQNRQEISRVLGQDVPRAVVLARFGPYQTFVNGYLHHIPFDSVRYYYVEQREIGGKRVAILGLNSAWTYARDHDRLQLLLGERQVRDATGHPNAQSADLRIALLHHPFEWLRDDDRSVCEPLVLQSCHFVLHGHRHQAQIGVLRSPDAQAMVLQAGACYQADEHPYGYNLIHLNLQQTGQSAVYMRTYSNRGVGFWTEDVLTYQNAKGKYPFALSEAIGVPDSGVGGDRSRTSPGATAGGSEETAIPTGPAAGLEPGLPDQPSEESRDRYTAWWHKRGFSDNPFAYASAEEVRDEPVPELLGQWYVDPDPSQTEGTPTLDKVTSYDDKPLCLVYAKRGSGKTFYRRWATRQIIEEENLRSTSATGGVQKSRWAIEIPSLRAEITLDRVTGKDLARSVYRYVYRYVHSQNPPPLPAEKDTAQILHACNEELRQAPPERSVARLYVFVDGVSPLFHERRVRQNKLALEALCELCREAAQRQGGPMLLRIFLPPQFVECVRTEIGADSSSVAECTIDWNADRCWQVVETRLNVYWRGAGSPNAQLLSNNLTTEIKRWLGQLQRREALSPRCVLLTLDGLARHLHGQKLAPDKLFGVEHWNQFLNTGSTSRRHWKRMVLAWLRRGNLARNLGVHCAVEPRYPLPRAPKHHNVGEQGSRRMLGLLDWIDRTVGRIGAIAIVGGTLAVAAFVLWCLHWSFTHGQSPGSCLEHAGYFFWNLLSGVIP